MTLDDDTCYRALTACDPRFDGRFFVGVSTTGIYCRPVCRARTPRRDRCTFYRTAPEAERAGFRACFRCRPELAPGSAPLDSIPRLVAAAVARIDEGFLNQHTLDALAADLGVTDRHLRRAMETELGVSPVELAQSRRLALAKRLLQDSALPLAQIAFASGFGSVRRFNALFQARFGRPPSALRRQHGQPASPHAIVLRLDYRPPLDWRTLLAFLRDRALPGVEQVSDGAYERTVRLPHGTGRVRVRHDDRRPALIAEVSLSLAGALMAVMARLRALFDLDAQPADIAACLGRDPVLAPLVQARPGLRLPGAFDAFEIAVRAVLGQQISVRAATTLGGRLVAAFGDPVDEPHTGAGPRPGHETGQPPTRSPGHQPGQALIQPPGRLFPTPERIAAVTEGELAAIGLPAARARTILALARTMARSSSHPAAQPASPPAAQPARLHLDRSAAVDDTIAALEALPGIGPWTAHYIAMRALRWPDAFPAADLGVRKALGGVTARAATQHAEAWRPWRAYATIYLWTAHAREEP